MSAFDDELQARLNSIRESGLWRELREVNSPQGPRIRVGGRELLNFSSNDYLGLANHPALAEAAARAAREFGAGTGASRLICGSLSPHHRLEERLAAFKGTEAALAFSTGYAAALGAITALLGREDTIVADRLVHACCVDAARLSGAKLQVFPHNDLDRLESILRRADQGAAAGRSKGRTLIVTESIFSMDGDHAPLRELVDLKDRFGAWLMVDEAHALGLYGRRRRGLADALELGDRIEVQLGTLGKAAGAAGGFIAGSRALVDLLINRARSFIFSTAPTPATAAAAMAGIDVIASVEGAERCERLWENVGRLKHTPLLAAPPQAGPPSPIVPIHIGDEAAAIRLATGLRHQGFFVPAIRYPTVARGSARLRVTLGASQSASDLADFSRMLGAIRNAPAEPATE